MIRRLLALLLAFVAGSALLFGSPAAAGPPTEPAPAGALADAASSDGAAAWEPEDLRVVAYAIFVLIVVSMLAIDLGVFHRSAHEVSFRESLAWSILWVGLGLGFTVVVYLAYEQHWLGLGLETPMFNVAAALHPDAALIVEGTVGGADAAKQYLTGYIVEKALAMDNIFVIAIVFGFFAVPAKYQHRVLFWGILGALVMRGAMIAVGAQLIAGAAWILILFGLLLVATSLKMALLGGEPEPGRNPVVRLVRRFVPVHPGFVGQRFFVRIDGVLHVTPLLLALIVVEIMDLVFAVDSIPAIFAITPDPFIVFTSNIFAVLGLRSLYFCLAALIARFRYLKPALILILAFVGVKLLLLSVPPYLDEMGGFLGLEIAPRKGIKIDTGISLAVVLGLLAAAVVLSMLRRAPLRSPHAPGNEPGPPERDSPPPIEGSVD